MLLELKNSLLLLQLHLKFKSHNPNQASVTPPSSAPSRTIVTRSMNDIFLPKKINSTSKHSLAEPPEPTCVTQALKDPNWCKAMSKEVTTLLNHGTWDLVPPALNQNLISCKFVLCKKRNPDSTISWYKARLVAKVFHQKPRVDYSQKFSPVVKPTTIRLILTIVVMHGWSLRQLDINNAFLHGTFEETAFMHQPPRFEDSIKPHYVCKLNKSIYGLKQAPRQWYKALRSELINLDFIHSATDTSLFIYKTNNILCYCVIVLSMLMIKL